MSDRTDAMVQALFNKLSLQDCSLQQVDYLAHQYPYFSTAQLLLLQKAETNKEAYAAQLQRTALHFSNPLQLRHWLHPEHFETEMPATELFQKPIPEKESTEENENPEDRNIAEAAEDPDTTTIESSTERPVIAASDQSTPTQPETQTTETPEPEKAVTPEEAPAITFEPYHTVDYFASQGIKLSQQEATSDTLGKQLKSFTEWLKTMKRLPETVVLQPADSAVEKKVEHLAAHSLDTSDVVTESMAEVWLKQGATEKAVDVYNKLSLRNPSKSAYFAAKISAIKQL